jgi:hypothetical protein
MDDPVDASEPGEVDVTRARIPPHLIGRRGGSAYESHDLVSARA